MKSLRVDEMTASTGALREGLLYDLLGRIRHEDVRDRTIRWLADHYHVDDEHATRVERTALECLDQVSAGWSLDREECRHYLSWAARLHEIGLEVAHAGYHKHSAYIVQHADMPGFSRGEQQILAAIIHAHRRKFLHEHVAHLPPDRIDLAIKLGTLFRLAVALNRSRSTKPMPEVVFSAKKNGITVRFPDDWLDGHPLTRADLDDDATRLMDVGIELQLK
jgi:exopolyphosphatase/guanosine-5'-triphosphate,3'-diphosphate pyrophosphatase